LKIADLTETYPLADIFNISTENLIVEKDLMKKAGFGIEPTEYVPFNI